MEVDLLLGHTIETAALLDKDFDRASLAASSIRSQVRRSEALAELGNQLARAGRKKEALKPIRESIKLLDEATDIAPVSVIFAPVPGALIADAYEGFNAARHAISVINRLPEPAGDERIGGRDYTKYSESVSLPLAAGVYYCFGWISSNNPTVAEAQMNELQSGHLKILARIAIERNRPHAVPQIIRSSN